MPYYDPSFLDDDYNPGPIDYPGFGVPPMRPRMTMDAPVIDPMEAGLPPTADRPPSGKPSRWQRITGAVKKYGPDLIGGALAAGSQPNIAGGGPTDVIRAAAAGYGVPQARAARQEMAERQRRADELAARKAEADIAQSEAQTQANKAHEALYQKQLNVPGFKEKFDWIMNNGGTKEQALIYASGGTLQDKSVKSKADNYTQIRPDVGEKLGILPNREGEYWIANSELQLLKPEKPEPPPEKKETTEEKERAKRKVETEYREDLAKRLGKKPGTRDYDKIMLKGDIEKPETQEQDKKATPAQFQAVANAKSRAMIAARAKYDREMKGGGVIPLDDTKKQAITDEYNTMMEFIQDEYEQSIVNLGGSVSPRTPGKHPAQAQPQRPIAPTATPAPPPAPRNTGEYLKGRFQGIF